MNPDMDRFRPPDASDEMAMCAGCGGIVHYTALDDSGLCQECRPDQPEKDKNENT